MMVRGLMVKGREVVAEGQSLMVCAVMAEGQAVMDRAVVGCTK